MTRLPLIACALLLAGCSGSGSGAATTASQQAPAPAATSPACPAALPAITASGDALPGALDSAGKQANALTDPASRRLALDLLAAQKDAVMASLGDSGAQAKLPAALAKVRGDCP